MDKKELRSFIKTLKKQHSKESLLEQSQLILSKLESTGISSDITKIINAEAEYNTISFKL